MEYLNLRLQATQYQKENGTERFRVRVSTSPVGEQRQGDAEEVTLAVDLRQRTRRLDKRSLNVEQIIALGEDLGQALFPPRVRKFYDRSLASLEEGQGLRLQLELDTYALADLPWEYLYFADPDTPAEQKGTEGFLVFNRRVSLVRYQVLAEPLGRLEPVTTDFLRLVALLSNPQNTASLDLSVEQQNIQKALAAVPRIKPEFYPNATIDMLLEALIRGAHVFHFSGHGKFEAEMGSSYGTQEGKAYLLLTGDKGEEINFSAQKLAVNLANRGVRFAMLGACESSKVDQVNAWTGIAPALTRAGLPAVVGMQFTIRDDNAIAFSKSFYQALADHQTIDEAVTAGRLAIYARSNDEQERDWGVPVLYLRAKEGVLFPKPAGESATEGPDKSPQPDPDITDALVKTQEALKRDQDYDYLQRRFEAILEQISSLSDYKALHDGLHEIQYSYYQNIIGNTKIVLDDKYAKYDLLKYLRDYRRVVTDMQDAARRKKVESVEDQWIAQLDQAGNDLEEGINKSDKIQINSATQTINQVIGTQPTIVNRKLYFAVYAYNGSLPELTDVMNRVREKINAIAPQSETVKHFQKGIDSLKEMNAKLDALIKEHNTWQDVDNQLRILPDLLDAGVSVFNKRWQAQRARIEPFYTSKEEETSVLYKSSVLLKGADDLLGSAIDENDPGGVRIAFENYCSQASDRFFYVDKSVMELCEKLSLIRKELD